MGYWTHGPAVDLDPFETIKPPMCTSNWDVDPTGTPGVGVRDLYVSGELHAIEIIAQKFAMAVILDCNIDGETGQIVQRRINEELVSEHLMKYRDLLAKDTWGIFIEMCLTIIAWDHNHIKCLFARARRFTESGFLANMRRFRHSRLRLLQIVTTCDLIPSVPTTTREERDLLQGYGSSGVRFGHQYLQSGSSRIYRRETCGTIQLLPYMMMSNPTTFKWWDMTLIDAPADQSDPVEPVLTYDSYDDVVQLLTLLEGKRFFIDPCAWVGECWPRRRHSNDGRCQISELLSFVASQYLRYPEWVPYHQLRMFIIAMCRFAVYIVDEEVEGCFRYWLRAIKKLLTKEDYCITVESLREKLTTVFAKERHTPEYLEKLRKSFKYYELCIREVEAMHIVSRTDIVDDGVGGAH